MSLARWLVLVFTIVSGSLIVGTGTLFYSSWQEQRSTKRHDSEAFARTVAFQVGIRTMDLQRLVESIARDPRLVDISIAGPEAVESEEAQLRRLIPDAVMVQILPPGLEDQRPGLSFADLDLAHRAATQAPMPMVHGFGTPESHLAVARAIKYGEEVTAVLLVGVGLRWLTKGLPSLPEGAIALAQGKLTLAFRGDSAFQSQPPAGSIPVKGTAWQVQYWVAPLGWRDRLGQLLIPLGAIVFAVGVLAGFAYWLRKALWHDATMLFTLVNDLTEGTVRGGYSLTIREFQSLVDKLLMSIKGNRGGIRKRRKKVSSADEKNSDSNKEAIPADMLVSMSAEEQTPQTATVTNEGGRISLPREIFRGCDIRGLGDEHLTPEVVRELGRVIGSEIQARGEQTVLVGRDERSSSEELSRALIEGLQASGRDVIDLGRVPVSIVYFATHYLTHRCGVMITASSSPAQYNGLKVVMDSRPLNAGELQGLLERYQRGELSSGMGMLESQDLLADYVGHIIDDVQIGRPMKVIMDSGAGVAGDTAAALLKTLGCEVEELHTDGLLDPTDPGSLQPLMDHVREDDEAELGLAFDGDGDRLAVVDAKGHWIPPDQVLMLLAQDALSREPGADIVVDIECSRHAVRHIVQQGGHPVQVAPGYCHLVKKMVDDGGAILAGGYGGHVIFRERWFGTIDGIYAAARLIEVLSAEPLSSDEIFAELPSSPGTPRLVVPLSGDEAEKALRLLTVSADKFFDDAKINTTWGVRVDFANGWGSVRVSNSLPALVFRFEADDGETLTRIQERFQNWFETIELPLSLPKTEIQNNG